jgi:hypothetical protein
MKPHGKNQIVDIKFLFKGFSEERNKIIFMQVSSSFFAKGIPFSFKIFTKKGKRKSYLPAYGPTMIFPL